jgi:signal peptide peptidase SppA
MNGTDRWAARLPVVGDRVDRRPVVSVVRLQGVITPSPSPVGRGAINLGAVESALSRAFGHDRVVAVALAVNSPGGAATQSALVADRIRGLADKRGTKVLAFCEDVAASGGYWLACAADEIYAHPTSLVGSIGVVSSGFGMAGLLERFGVERRVHTAGDRKVRLDPFRPEQPDDVAWLARLQGDLHDQFVGWVTERRSGKLTGDADDLFSGEVWTGTKAAELGLVDGLGTMREVITDRYPDAHVVAVEPRKALLARLGLAGAAARLSVSPVEQLLDVLEQRATWSRFGL